MYGTSCTYTQALKTVCAMPPKTGASRLCIFGVGEGWGLPFFSESTIHDMTCTALCCSFSQSDSHMSRRVGITVCTV